MNKSPIRVLQCVSNMDRGGIETMLMNYYRNIDRSKVQFDFLVNKNKPGAYDEEIKKMGGKIFLSPGLNPLKSIEYQSFMKKLFIDHPEYRIIHCQNETMGYYALKAAKKSKVPVRIAHSHNTLIRKDFKYLIKEYCKQKLNSVANVEVACGKEAGLFLFGDEVMTIKNAIDTSKFVFNKSIRRKMRKKYNLIDKYVIGNVARFEPQKNHDFLIDIFNVYAKKDKKAVLVLVGTGSLKKKIETKVKKLGISEKVIFLGDISNVYEVYQMMDIFLLPSFHEGLPVVGVEAQVASLPCIFSSNITKEIDIQDSKFLDIDNSTNEWCNEIENFKNYERIDMKQVAIQHGYDIVYESKKLEKWYLDLYKGDM